jgi:DNA helicase-2/ATP-dependent DNA helicase PcrA
VEGIRLFAREQGCSMWEASQQMVRNKALTARASNAVSGFISLVDGLAEGALDKALSELADRVIKVSGLYDFHKAEKGEKGQARIENLDELVSACRVFVSESEEALSPLHEFLDTAALDSGEAQADEFDDAVQLMTLHSAKGLEFPLVFLAGAEENLFPHRMSIEEPGRLEEERRLCYVGITRAMEKLVITYAESRRLHGNENFNSVSRFIKEIPSELLEEVRVKSTISRPISFGRSSFSGRGASYGGESSFGRDASDFAPKKAKPGMSDKGEETGFYLGQRVMHPVFGEGKILHFEGDGPGARVQVKFTGEGTKWLILKFAKLEAA